MTNTYKNVYVSEYTPQGNVYKVSFEHTGGALTVKGDTCRTIFYSSTYNKSVRSLRFDINGGSGTTAGTYYVNGSGSWLPSLSGISVISGSGKLSSLDRDTVSVITSSGISELKGGSAATKPVSSSASGDFTITGTGNGHNVGMSQYGARAMAELGYDCYDILEFYYTDVTIK